MKWKIKPCFQKYRRISEWEITGQIIECVEDIPPIDDLCPLFSDDNYIWKTCPHGKCQLVEENNG